MRNASTIYASASAKIQRLGIGGGGTPTQLDIANDGTMVAACDSAFGYVRGPTDKRWTQLIQMGVNLTEANGKYNYAATGGNSCAGAYAVAIAATNSNHILIATMGFLYRSTDKGVTFAKTGLALNAYMDPNQAGVRVTRKRLMIDPGGTSVFAFIDPTPTTGGLQVSSNSGTSFAKNAQVPAGTTTNPGCLASDRSSSIISGSYQTVYAHTDGTGIYKSTGGWGGTFSPLTTTGGPVLTNILSMIAFAGKLLVCDGTGIKSFNGTSWSQVSTDTRLVALAVNEADTTKVYAMNDAGQYAASTDSGATWTVSTAQPTPGRIATDVPWLATTQEISLSCGDLKVDPTDGSLKFAEGIGMWQLASPPATSGAAITYTSITLGIEQMCSMQITVTPEGDVLYAAQDRTFTCFPKGRELIQQPYQGTYYGPSGSLSNTAIDHGSSIDYAADNSSYRVGVSSANMICAITSNKGKNWAAAPTLPSGGTVMGSIALGNSGNAVWFRGGGRTDTRFPVYTTNGGTTWTECKFNGVNTSGLAFPLLLNWQLFSQRVIVAADKTVPGKFHAFLWGTDTDSATDTAYSGMWVSTDYGANWTRTKAGKFNASNIDAFDGKLKMVPTKTGHMIWCAGDVSGDDVASDVGAWFSSDGGVTFARVPGIYEPEDVIFIAPMYPGGYPTLVMFGYSAIGDKTTRGLFACFNFDPANVAGASFVKVADPYFLGSYDAKTILGGHPSDTVGRLYAGKGGSGLYAIDIVDKAGLT